MGRNVSGAIFLENWEITRLTMPRPFRGVLSGRGFFLGQIGLLAFIRRFPKSSPQTVSPQPRDERCFVFGEALLIQVTPISSIDAVCLFFGKFHVCLSMPAQPSKFGIIEEAYLLHVFVPLE